MVLVPIAMIPGHAVIIRVNNYFINAYYRIDKNQLQPPGMYMVWIPLVPYGLMAGYVAKDNML